MFHLAWELVILKSQALFHAPAVLGAMSFTPVSTVEVLLVLASGMWTKADKGKMGGSKDLDAQR